jgi:type I restriction enzyme R subunit
VLAPQDHSAAPDGNLGRAVRELQRLGYTCLSPAAVRAERDSVREVLLVERLVAALGRLNPGLSAAHLQLALRALGAPAADLRQSNQRIHGLLTRGLSIERGARRPKTVRYLDPDELSGNDLVVAWQLPVRGVHRQVVLDLVVFINGIPLAVLACAPDEFQGAEALWLHATLADLWRQQEGDATCHELGVPRLFESVHLIAALAEERAVYGSVLTPPHGYTAWITPEPPGEADRNASPSQPASAADLLLRGMLAPRRLFELLHHFVAFPGGQRTLCLAPEYVAVARAVDEPARSGVLWHALPTAGGRQQLLLAWLLRALARAADQPPPLVVVEAEADRAALLPLLADVPATVLGVEQARAALAAGALPTTPQLVLIAEAQALPAQELLQQAQAALPRARILALTSTPIPTAERDAAPYLAAFNFTQALSLRAAVPVYREARAAQPPAPSAAERVRRICRDLGEHFARVVRPAGGRAYVLAQSSEAARLYRKTLRRQHPALAHEIQVGCAPPSPAPAALHVVYVDAPLPGRGHLLIALSVSHPAPDKLFGLVIDYAGAAPPPALADWPADEVADAIRQPADELPRLRQHHQAAVRLLSAARNLHSLEQCLKELTSEARRIHFAASVYECAEALEVLYDSPGAQGYLHELRWLGQVLLGAAARYQDARLGAAVRGPRVRRLVEESLQDAGVVEHQAPAWQPAAGRGTARLVYEVLTAPDALAAAETHPRYGRGAEEHHELAVQLAAALDAQPTLQGESVRALIEGHLLAAGYSGARAALLTARLLDRLHARAR